MSFDKRQAYRLSNASLNVIPCVDIKLLQLFSLPKSLQRRHWLQLHEMIH